MNKQLIKESLRFLSRCEYVSEIRLTDPITFRFKHWSIELDPNTLVIRSPCSCAYMIEKLNIPYCEVFYYD